VVGDVAYVLVVIAGGDSVVVVITADYIFVSVRSDVMMIVS